MKKIILGLAVAATVVGGYGKVSADPYARQTVGKYEMEVEEISTEAEPRYSLSIRIGSEYLNEDSYSSCVETFIYGLSTALEEGMEFMSAADLRQLMVTEFSHIYKWRPSKGLLFDLWAHTLKFCPQGDKVSKIGFIHDQIISQLHKNKGCGYRAEGDCPLSRRQIKRIAEAFIASFPEGVL